jgi:hypothetical protein
MEALRQRRRYLLHRILPDAEAAVETARLKEQGVRTIALAESAVRAAAQPLLTTGGNPEGGVFALEGGGPARQLTTADVLIIVWGTIRREPLSQATRSMRDLKRAATPCAAESDLCHIHMRSSLRPLELDPGTFVFTEARGRVRSTPLRVRDGIASLATDAEIDRGFAQEAPALGVSSAPARSALAEAFGAERRNDGRKRRETFLDNVAQFRFYSAWRGMVARRAVGLSDTPGPPL